MNINIELRPEVTNALDALCRNTGASRESAAVDLITAGLGVAVPEFTSMTSAPGGFAPIAAEAKTGAPGGFRGVGR